RRKQGRVGEMGAADEVQRFETGDGGGAEMDATVKYDRVSKGRASIVDYFARNDIAGAEGVGIGAWPAVHNIRARATNNEIAEVAATNGIGARAADKRVANVVAD